MEIVNPEDVESVVCGTTTTRADSWEVEIPVIESCSKAPAVLYANVSVKSKVKIDALMEKFPNIEWLAYIIGDKERPLDVDDLYIPQQDVTGTSVDNIQCPEFNTLSIIGVMHSHHGMGTGFSGTDHAWINQNHNLSIVVAKNGIEGQMRWVTPCGGLKIVPVKCRVKYDVEFDKEVFLQESVPKINQKYTNFGKAGVTTYAYQNGAMAPITQPGLNRSQASYVGSGSLKDALATKKKKGNGNGVDIGFSNEQSLADAINEAFAETDIAETTPIV